MHLSCDRHVSNDLVDKNLQRGCTSEEEGKEKVLRCETFLISVTTCSNFWNMGIKRQVLRKLGPFIDKTKVCDNRKF